MGTLPPEPRSNPPIGVQKRLLLINSASSVAERIISASVLVWLYQYLVRRISPEEYSLYPVVTALLVFVPPLMSILVAGLSRFIVEASTQGDDRRATQYVSTMLPLLLGVAVAVVAAGMLMARYVDSLLNIAPQQLPNARLMITLLMWGVAVRLLLSPFGVGLYVYQKFVLINILTVAQSLLRVILLFLLFALKGPGVLWVVVASFASEMCFLGVTTILSMRMLPSLRFRRSEIRWQFVSVLASFGFWNMLMWFAGMVQKSSDPLVLNRLGTPKDVTSFHLGSLADNQIAMALGLAAGPLQPALISLHAQGKKEALQRAYQRGGRYLFWAALLVATPAIVFRNELWSLYLGPAYDLYPQTAIIMTLLLARYWLECPIGLLGTIGHATNQLRKLSVLLLCAAASNVLMSIIFIRYFGLAAVGAALGTLTASLIWDVVLCWYGLKLMNLQFAPWFHAVIWRGVLPSLIAGVFGMGVQRLTRIDSWPELLAAAAAVALVYMLSVVFFVVDDEERIEIRRVIARFRSVPRTSEALGAVGE